MIGAMGFDDLNAAELNLIKIADQLFSIHTCNWGRVVAFCALIKCCGENRDEIHDSLCSLFASYSTCDTLGIWLEDNGGWVLYTNVR